MTKENKLKIHRSGSGCGQSPTPSCTAQTFEVTSTTSPSVSSIFGTVPTFSQHQTIPFWNAFQSKSTNIFGNSVTPAESKFVFSFGNCTSPGFESTQPNNSSPGFGSTQPNNASSGFGITQPKNLFGQTMSCDFKLPPVTSNSFSATTFDKRLGTEIKFKPVTDKESYVKNGLTKTIDVAFQCITFMDGYGNKSLEELRYEDYLIHFRIPRLHKGIGHPFCSKERRRLRSLKLSNKADSKQKSSVVDAKVDNSPFDFSKFSIFDDCEPPKTFQKELWKSSKAASHENEAIHKTLDKLTKSVNSLSFRLDQLEQFSSQNACPTKEKSTDLLPWILYKPKLNLTENKVPEDTEVQRLAGLLNCVILTVLEQDRKEIELLMVLVSAWPSLPDYVKTFTYNKMEVLWQALSSTIRSEEHQKANQSSVVNERQPYLASPIYYSTKKESP